MLGRNGYDWEYEEIVVFDDAYKARVALETFVNELQETDDFRNENIKLEVFTYEDNSSPMKSILRLRQNWKSKLNVRFISDGNRLGITFKPKKIKAFQVYEPESDNENGSDIQ